MSLAVIGSIPSPYVRRVRILLEKHSLSYEFKVLDILGKDRREVLEISPIGKIPILIDDDKKIPDSNLIFGYLNQTYFKYDISLEEKIFMNLTDEASLSLVNTLMLKRSGLDVLEDRLFFNLQRERINILFNYLDTNESKFFLQEWRPASIWLYCLIDWANFRELIDLKDYPNLINFINKYKNKDEVINTNPRQGQS